MMCGGVPPVLDLVCTMDRKEFRNFIFVHTPSLNKIILHVYILTRQPFFPNYTRYTFGANDFLEPLGMRTTDPSGISRTGNRKEQAAPDLTSTKAGDKHTLHDTSSVCSTTVPFVAASTKWQPSKSGKK